MCVFCNNEGFSAEQQAQVHAPQAAGSTTVSTFNVSFGGTAQNNMLALVAGSKWDSTNISYSFPDATSDYTNAPGSYGSGELTNGFSALNAAQQTAARAAFAMISSYTGITFTEETVNEGNADILMAHSNTPSTAWAYYPGSGVGGDAFFNGSGGNYTNPVQGTYAWHTFLHELGHTLGLKHGHDSSGNGALASDVDQMPYSVMTYKSYEGSAGANYTNEYYGYAQSYMAYDIAALQAIYGVNWSTNSGDTTYTWSETTGEMFINGVGQGAPGSNRILQTIWDGGGTDTIDLSNYNSGMTVDLAPGGYLSFSSAQTAQLGAGIYADGNVYLAFAPDGKKAAYIDNLIAGTGQDTINGNNWKNVIDGKGGKDLIYGHGGEDIIFGSGGSDTIYGGAGDDWISGGIGRDFLKGNGGADTFFFDERSNKDVIKDFELFVDHIEVPDNAQATLIVSNTGHLTVEYNGAWMILRGFDAGDATLGDLLA